MYDYGLLILIILVALLFDFINGFHDTANAISTTVATGALQPLKAILLAIGMEFLGALYNTSVAKTLGKGLVDPTVVTQIVILAALLGAVFWSIVTWKYSIPSSSSHALVGALVGAVLVSKGVWSVNYWGLTKIVLVLVIAPIISIFIGNFLMKLTLISFSNNHRPSGNRIFRWLEIITASLTAFFHGTNDAQKSMGIITLGLFSAGLLKDFEVPLWVIFICIIALGLGTLVGGWRIIGTMGNKITHLNPMGGFVSNISSSLVIIIATYYKVPVSTTHVVTSSIMGVGSAKRITAVQWLVAKNMILAWLITIPICGIIGGVFYGVLKLILS